MSDLLPFDIAALLAFIQVVIVDVTLAGDNALVVGMAAAGLAKADRGRAIFIGIVLATALRIVFALLAATFLAVIGLTLAGGVLLLWVAYKMLREILARRKHGNAEAAEDTPKRKTIGQAVWQIAVADLSMSLDNVLAVAGTARDHLWVLVSGLVLSVALMGAASTLVARLLARYHNVVWLGLAIVSYVALSMIWSGWTEIHAHYF